MAKKRRSAAFINTTVRLHVVHDAEQNARIVDAARQQRTVHNLTISHLLEHRSDEPLRKSTAKGVVGLQGRWVEWRTTREDLAAIPSKVARPAIAAAADQVAKWEETNRRHAVLVARAVEDGEPIPRAVQKRRLRPEQLHRSRKHEERLGRHRVRIDQGVSRRGSRTLYVPGMGEVKTREPVPEDLDVRACILLERTPPTRLGSKLPAGERTFRLHLSGRLPAPALKQPDGPGACVGIDHGVVTPMTAVDDDDHVLRFEHDVEQARLAHRRVRKAQKRRNNCRRGSKRWKARKLLARRIRAKLNRRRRHDRLTWARLLCSGWDTVCIEKLDTARMTRSSKGTAEKHGRNVRRKAGLNRSMLGIAVHEQTTLIERAAEKRGARIVPVPAWGTSTTCSSCGYRHRKNRDSQAAFRCRRCGHAQHADVNAARNMRIRGRDAVRARVNASEGAAAPLPEGADAGPRNGRLEQSRRYENRTPPERAPDRGDRGSRTPRKPPMAQESWPETATHESCPYGQDS